MTARVSTLKWHMIERCNRLLKQTQKMIQMVATRVIFMKAQALFNVGNETFRDKSGQAVANHNESSHERTVRNEVNLDFRIPGLPHSVVKHAQSTSVRELIQRIENHSHRHALQQGLRQNKAYNPFSAESKRMIQDVGNVEPFDLFETDLETQCEACLSYWSEHIVCCICGHLSKHSGQSTFSLYLRWSFCQFQNT